MIRIAAMSLVLAFAGTAGATDPPKPLAELVKDLRDPDREKRLVAVEAIRDHYKDKVLEVLPQMIEVLGEELDRPRQQNRGRAYLLAQTICQVADMAGKSRVVVVQKCTVHASPLIRAGAYRVWLAAALDKNCGVDQAELLGGVRRGSKDVSPLVRGQAIEVLRATSDAPVKVTDETLPLLIAALADREKPRDGVDSPAVHATNVLRAYKAKAKPAIAALGEAAASETDEAYLIGGCCFALRGIAQADETTAEEVVAILRPIFSDTKRSIASRGNAVLGLVGIGAAARRAVPDVVAILEEPKVSSELRDAAYTVLINLGPRAVAAVESLVSRLEKTKDAREQHMICSAFKAMGPVAIDAVEPLKRWMETVRDPSLGQAASEALVAIIK